MQDGLARTLRATVMLPDLKEATNIWQRGCISAKVNVCCAKGITSDIVGSFLLDASRNPYDSHERQQNGYATTESLLLSMRVLGEDKSRDTRIRPTHAARIHTIENPGSRNSGPPLVWGNCTP